MKAYNSKAGERSWNSIKKEEPTSDGEDADQSERGDEVEPDEEKDDGAVINTINVQQLLTDDEYATMLADAVDPQDGQFDTFVDIEAIHSALQSSGAALGNWQIS